MTQAIDNSKGEEMVYCAAQLKTRCGCERTVTVRWPPPPEICVPLSPTDPWTVELAPRQEGKTRKYRLVEKTCDPMGTRRARYVEA